MSNLVIPRVTWGADCLAENAQFLPRTIPVIWPYVTGTPGLIWPESLIDEFTNSIVITVDQGYGAVDVFGADEYDIEAGAFTVNEVADITKERQTHKLVTRAYVTWDDYGQLKGKLSEMGIDSNVYYRIADWNLDQHMADEMLHADVYAGQWASPTSNPRTLIPGTATTLFNSDVDLNVVFLPLATWQDPAA